MNSLEFIDLEIEKLKAILYLDDVVCELSDNDYKLCNDRIKKLQQIKAELEAWEICKRHLILDKEFHQIDLHLHHDTKYKEDYLKLKKALEVKENVD